MEKKRTSLIKFAKDLFRKKDVKRTIEEYEQLLHTSDQVSPGFLNQMADLYYHNGQMTLAVEKYLESAEAYSKENLINNAIAVCKKVLRLLPGNYDIYMKMGELYKKQGLHSDAVSNFREYIAHIGPDTDTGNAVTVYRSLLQLEPEDEALHSNFARYLEEAGRESEAIEQYKSLFFIYHRKGRKEKRTSLEEKLASFGIDTETLLAELQKKTDIEMTPHVETEKETGETGERGEAATGEPEEGEGEFIELGTGYHEVQEVEKSEALYPTDLEDALKPRRNAGETADEGMEEEEEEEEGEEEVKRPTLEFQSPVPLGEEEQEKEEEEEEKVSQDVSEEDDGEAGTEVTGKTPKTGGVFVIEENELIDYDTIDEEMKPAEEKPSDTAEEMLEKFKKGIDMHVAKEDFKSRFDLAMSYMNMKLWDEAIEGFSGVLHSPKYALPGLEFTGKCYLQKGDTGKARECFEKGLELAGYDREDYINIRYELGCLYLTMNRIDDAFEHIMHVHGLNENFKDIQELVEKVKSLKKGDL
jgi:tetratricopeptide (TPR) repeat protein